MKDAFLQFVTLLRPHSRTRSDGNAYADDELAPAARQRFEKHLARCGECSRAVAAAREVKALLATLPTEQAPRSFRLTPQMLSLPVAPAPPRRNPAPLRFAQATASLAAFALLAVVTVGALGGSSSQSTTITAADSSLNSNQSKAAAPRSAAATASNESSGGVASGAPASGAADRSSGSAGPTTATSPSTGGAYSVPGTAGDSAVGQQRPRADSSEGNALSTRTWLEIALLVVIAAATAAWYGLTRNLGREHS